MQKYTFLHLLENKFMLNLQLLFNVYAVNND